LKHLSLLFFCFVFLYSSCTKIRSTDVGSGLIPPIDGVNTKDTVLDVLSVNAADSTIRVALGESHVVGFTNDPLFGKTTAKINVQLLPTYYPYTFGASKEHLYLDSVVLVLSYAGVWGDTNQNLSLHVYQIADDADFRYDTSYTNKADFALQEELTNGAVMIDPKTLGDSFHVFQDSGINQIRIRLNNSLGEKLLHTYDTLSAYKSDSAFKTYFKGFQIAADEGIGNALLRINLTDVNTKLALYYRYNVADTGKLDTTVRYFIVNQFTSAHSNYIKRDRSGSQLSNYYPPSTANQELLFLEGAPGLSAKLQIPGLTGFPNVVIHRAELIANQVPDINNPTLDSYFYPPLLFLSAYSADSSRPFALYKDLNFYGGSLSTSSLSLFGVYPFPQLGMNNQTYFTYHFNISRHVQDIVTHQIPNYSLLLYAPYNEAIYLSETSTYQFYLPVYPFNYAAYGRVRLAGGAYTDVQQKMRLHIVYSLIHE